MAPVKWYVLRAASPCVKAVAVRLVAQAPALLVVQVPVRLVAPVRVQAPAM